MNKTLLKFQIGPVQEFIAQARSTRDLWSGSYLLSWLMAAGAANLIQSAGGDKNIVISPNPETQPLLDFHLKGARVTDLREIDADTLLTANFTNIMLAELPAESAETLNGAMLDGMRNQWMIIAKCCWNRLEAAQLVDEADKAQRNRFFDQAKLFPQVTWQLTPLPSEGLLGLVRGLPLEPGLLGKLETATDENGLPDLFPAQITRNSWQLDAVRQVRVFHAWREGGWRTDSNEDGLAAEKDSLSGSEEAVVGGKEWWDRCVKPWVNRARSATKQPNGVDKSLWPILFRERQKNDHYGAIQLIKRIWHWAYLDEICGLPVTHRREPSGKEFPFPSTVHIALHDPAKNIREYLENELEGKVEEEIHEHDDHTAYFAVLALDGDQMGKWLGGEKNSTGPTRLFRCDLSERLGNFALYCARPIVEACDGRLIYAGGEDVLALLPADTVSECARLLRLAYHGDIGLAGDLRNIAVRLRGHHLSHGYQEPPRSDYNSPEISASLIAAANGSLFKEGPEAGALLLDRSPVPKRQPEARLVRLPGGLVAQYDGERPEVSCGIAIAHFKEPLQDVVQAAQAAERRAKSQLGRAAIAVTLVKHSGETVRWGCKWKSGALEFLDMLQRARAEEIFSARLPHRLAAILSRYLLSRDAGEKPWIEPAAGFDSKVNDLIFCEFREVFARQRGKASADQFEEFRLRHKPENLLAVYIEYLDEAASEQVQKYGEGFGAELKIRAMIDLCRVAAFIEPAVYSQTFEKGHVE